SAKVRFIQQSRSEVELGLMECNRADILSFVKGISSNNHPRFSGEGGRGDATGYHWPGFRLPHTAPP
ncbi:hypothetical protein, partial [Klebsiella pneumoniae]|uniref:hypothetical protein n=1 Tax=Klebsiella pneumoniae TaxID=573 RepID=UPI001953470F